MDSTLPNFSENYEKLIYNELYDYFDEIRFPINMNCAKNLDFSIPY